MRTSRPLDALFPRTRQQLLAAILLHPDRCWYLSDLARHLGVRPSSIQRELASLVEGGLLQRREEGNRVYYAASPESPLLPELQGLLTKTAGIADVVRDVLLPFARKIACAFVYGSMARGEEVATSDVDVLVIGRVALGDLTPALRRAERLLGRPVNVSLYSPEEFAKKRDTGHHFLQTVLESPKLFLLGSAADLAPAPSRTPRAEPRNEQARTRRPAGRRRARSR